jgi:hypothetical protein
MRLERVRRAMPVLFRDGVGLLGVGLIAYGAWLIYEPSGFIVAGAMLVGAAWLMARRS